MKTKHMHLGHALLGVALAAGLASGVAQAATQHTPYHDHKYELSLIHISEPTRRS